MNKKKLIVACLSVLIFLSSRTLYAADTPKEFPRELRNMGYSKKSLISYRKTASVEYFTFPDSRTEEKGATITFVVENGEVVCSFKSAIKVNVQEKPSRRTTNDGTEWLFEHTHEDVEGKIRRGE